MSICLPSGVFHLHRSNSTRERKNASSIEPQCTVDRTDKKSLRQNAVQNSERLSDRSFEKGLNLDVEPKDNLKDSRKFRFYHSQGR
jgi:hypothetical protein